MGIAATSVESGQSRSPHGKYTCVQVSRRAGTRAVSYQILYAWGGGTQKAPVERNWYNQRENDMGKVTEIETQVEKLTPRELAAFRAWFVKYDTEVWDRQFEADAKSGKFDRLTARARRDHATG